MTSSIKFTIIVPIYNAEVTLKRCIDSILIQTYKDFELILVDDGSKDKSSEICDEYKAKDARVKVIHKQNGGVSSARNAGILVARGEYLVFVDADDYIDSDYLKNFSQSSADIIACGYRIFGKDQKQDVPEEQTIFKGINAQNYLTYNIDKSYFRAPWAKAFKRVLFSDYNIRFNCKIRFGEDTELNFRIIKYAQSLETLSYVGYYYYYGDPFLKWTLRPKEYAYAIEQMIKALSELKCSGVETAKENILRCFNVFFFIGLWNAKFTTSVSLSIQYFIHRLYRYMPYKGVLKFRKLASIILIPYINIFRKVRFGQ